MARRNEPLSAGDIADLATRAEDMAVELRGAVDRMEKAYTSDPGDAVEVLRQLAALAESSMALSRMVAGCAKMREQIGDIRSRAQSK